MKKAAWSVMLALGLALPARPAAAQTPQAAQAEATTSESRLAPLPKAPAFTLAPPEREDRERLDALLGRLTGPDAAQQETASRDLMQAAPRSVPAIAERLGAIAADADREAMKRLLGEARRHARDQVRAELRSEGRRDKVVTPDYLGMLLTQPKVDAKSWRDLVCIVAMSRMLVEVGTVEAVRELIEVYVRFGEFLRADTQLQLEKLGDKGIAALIEARRHKAEKIARWAERQLDTLGKAVPGEAVQTDDPEVLADVLRAYGRVRDPDAARIVITFANSERTQVREAARQAVALMGDVAQWQLRDTYEDFVGQRPPRDWSWERTARELFDRFDRQRLARVYGLFEQGKKAESARKLEEMRGAFDRVLGQNPHFDRRSEMAKGYLDYARSLPQDKRHDALVAARRVERIASSDELRKAATSLRLTLEAEELLSQGVIDQVLLRRATEVDPTNDRAQDALRRALAGREQAHPTLYRYLAAGVIGLVALAAMVAIWLGLKRGRRSPESLGSSAAGPREVDSRAGGARSGAKAAPESGHEPRSTADLSGEAAAGATSADRGSTRASPDPAPETAPEDRGSIPGAKVDALETLRGDGRSYPNGDSPAQTSTEDEPGASCEQESQAPESSPFEPIDPIGELLGEDPKQRRS